MSAFEIIFTGLTIVLALAIARLLEGLRDAFDPARRYWIHSLWILTKLILSVTFFWTSFLNRQNADADADFLVFLGLITVPGLLFLQAHALVTAHPDAVDDWRAHFWSIRKWFFSTNLFLVAAMFFLSVYGVNTPPNATYAAMVIGVIFSAAGYISSNERLHATIAVVAFVNMAIQMVVTGLRG